MLQVAEHSGQNAMTARAIGIFRFLAAAQGLRGRTVHSTEDFTTAIPLESLRQIPLTRLSFDDPGQPLMSIRPSSGSPVYDQLFSTRIAASARAEELELVLGVGQLAYAPVGSPEVSRHLLTLPVRLELAEESGQLELWPESDAVPSCEADRFVDLGAVADPDTLAALTSSTGDYSGTVLDKGWLRTFLTQIVHAIDPRGEVLTEGTPTPPGPGRPLLGGTDADPARPP